MSHSAEAETFKKKPIVIQQKLPDGRLSELAFVPVGMFLNCELKDAQPGSVVIFADRWKREKRILVRKCLIPVNSSVFDFMLKSIYGEKTHWETMRKAWEAEAVIEGYGDNAFNTDMVYLVEVVPYNEDEYFAIQEQKKREAEMRQAIMEQARREEERKKERAALLRLARKGIYRHKDIL